MVLCFKVGFIGIKKEEKMSRKKGFIKGAQLFQYKKFQARVFWSLFVVSIFFKGNRFGFICWKHKDYVCFEMLGIRLNGIN